MSGPSGPDGVAASAAEPASTSRDAPRATSTTKTGRIIAVLGAESTGKTTLAHELANHLRAAGRDCVVVDETLRSFCERHGRTPRIDEQAGIADTHAARLLEAASRHELVLADTTGVQTAVYSDWVFGDRSLLEPAGRWHREHVALTLLTALDLPWVADGLQRDGPQVREPIDGMLRLSLAAAGIAYAVALGDGPRRAASAFAAWQAHERRDTGFRAGRTAPAATDTDTDTDDRDPPVPRWRPWCADCDDPDCERAAFHRR